MSELQKDLQELTSTVVDANHKPLLRGTLESSLLKLGHGSEAVSKELDAFFARPVN